MPAELTLDLSQCLVARKGEVITCPECGEGLIRFVEDSYGTAETGGWLIERLAAVRRDGCEWCPCGGAPTRSGGGAKHRTGKYVELLKANAPQIHLSTGWRALGGE